MNPERGGYNSDMEKYAPQSEFRDLLSDPESVVHENAAWLKKLQRDHPADFEQRLDALPQPDLERKFDRMIQRVGNETKILEEVEDTITSQNFLNNQDEREYSTKVLFGQKKKLGRRNALGTFYPLSEKVRIAEKNLTKKELWAEIIAWGMPRSYRTLDHELIHFWQNHARRHDLSADERLERAYRGFKGLLKNVILAYPFALSEMGMKAMKRLEQKGVIPEAAVESTKGMYRKLRDVFWNAQDELMGGQKYERVADEMVAHRAGRVFDKRDSRTVRILELLRRGYGFDSPKQIDRAIVTSQVISRLRALGYGDRDIATKVAKAEYDDDQCLYPKLEEDLAAEAKGRGIALEDLDTVADLKRIKSETENFKAINIAAQELVESKKV